MSGMGQYSQGNAPIKRLWKWTKRILLACVAIFLTAAVTGAIWHWSAARSTERKYPPPGQLIDVGTHKLHFHVEGEGWPIVVLENGSGASSGELDEIQRELARSTQVCAYDRAGFGWSDPGPRPRTTQQIVAELRNMLSEAGLDPPYILIGCSAATPPPAPDMEWWMESQKVLRSIANDVQKIDCDCGHAIPYERPDFVVDAVTDMITLVRSKTPENTPPR